MTDIKYQIQKPVDGEFRDRGSRFLGFAYPINTLDEIKSHLKTLKVGHSDATHICYAYRMMTNSEVDEYSTDAGEPSGSSGIPILNVLRRNQLIDTVIFIARYYGGTKLGIPGLINAYGSCAENCIENAIVEKSIKFHTIQIRFAYEHQRILDSLCRQFDCESIRQDFGIDILLEIKIRADDAELFSRLLSDKTNGQVLAEIKYLH